MTDDKRRVSTRSLRKGALIEETYAICRVWDRSSSYAANVEHLRTSNAVGATNSAWLREVMATFTGRFPDAASIDPLVVLAQSGVELDIWRPCLFWQLAERDALYYGFAVDWLFPTAQSNVAYVRTEDVVPYVTQHVEPHVAAGGLTDYGRLRAARDLLRMAAAFGLLTAGASRQFRPYQLPDACLLYGLHALAERAANALRMVEAPEWRLFLLAPAAVEQALLRLHQFQRLHYQAAGSIVELKLPYPTRLAYAESLAHAWLERTPDPRTGAGSPPQ